VLDGGFEIYKAQGLKHKIRDRFGNTFE